jgi:tetratricopeptide (TPR) repeat protein
VANSAAIKARRSNTVVANAPPSHWRELAQQSRPVCLLLILATFILYVPIGRFDFVNYDDGDYVNANSHVQAGLTWANVVWAFTTGHASNWHPLTWVSHMLDWQVFGNRPGPQHLVSAALHAINAGLLFVGLRRLTGAHWRSALVAAWFGLHPLRVESVAWISERKDVLSGLFFFLTLMAYYQYVNQSALAQAKLNRKWLYYLLALTWFALGLMSKPMLVTVPFVLLLLDYWPLDRFRLDGPGLRSFGRLVLEKTPFLLLAAVSSVITFLVQRHGGAVSTSLTMPERIANALVSYVRYIAKTFWPQKLSVLYPHPGHWPGWQVGASGLFLLLVSAFVVWEIRRSRYLAVGWFWFIGGLVPVIGLIQVGIQSMADRYTYMPSVGLFIAVAWGIEEAVRRWSVMLKAAAVAAIVSIVACAGVTAHQLGFWRNSEALFTRAIDVTSDNYLAYNNLGFYLSGKGKLAEAKEFYKKSIAINPQYADALNNLGFALAGERDFAEAIPYYVAALRSNPNQAEIHNNFGNALSELGKLDEAIGQYRTALKEQPDHADANNNLGIALAMQGKLAEAVEHFRAAIRAKPNYASAHSNLGNALAADHQIPRAILEYQESLRLNPNDPQAHNNLGNVLLQHGKTQEAIGQYTSALRLNGNNPEAHFNLGVALTSIGKRAEAAEHFREVLRLNPANTEARAQLRALTSGQ